jgi:thioredoxin reductase (NADPH)
MTQQRTAAPTETDAVIIGAGPVGLFQVFELGLLDIKAHVIDALPYPGGQPVELYPDKPIYDIPGIPVCSGRELTESLLQQIAPFQATFHLAQEVTQVQQRADGRLHIATSAGQRFITKTLFIAAGVGAFQARKLNVDGLEAFEGTQVLSRIGSAAAVAGQHVVIVGGEDAALDCAIRLATQAPHRPASVTLLHRRANSFKATPAMVEQIHRLIDSQALAFMAGQITGYATQQGRLNAVQVTGADGQTHSLPADTVLVFLGLSPKLGPIAQWGLDMERKQLRVDTERFATRIPNIFAVGDINTYPGKKKLILCGFHECTLAAFAAASVLAPEQRVLLQYTTTSPRLHRLLGVASPTLD